MIEQFPSFPLESFFATEPAPGQLDPNPKMLPALKAADVVFGRDVATGDQFLVFGRDVLHAIVQIGMSRPVNGLVIEIDQAQKSQELEKLLALMHVIKGRIDYLAGETFEGEISED